MQELPKISGIYKILNIVTGDFYIGSAMNIRSRISKHKSMLKNKQHVNPILQNAWNKYGPDAFTIEILEETTKEQNLLVEQKYLDMLKPKYNIALSATSPMLGRKQTSEWCKNHSKLMTGRKRPDQSITFLGEKNPFYGKKHKAETIQKMREKLINGKTSAGENNPSAKIDLVIVNNIRKDYTDNNLSGDKLSKKYNISKTQIYRILNFECWKED